MRTRTIIVAVIIFIAVAYCIFVAAPSNFPLKYDLTVTAGETSSAISRQLADDGVIRSRRTFQLFMVALGNDGHISQGDYYFEQPLSAIAIALRISDGDFGISRTSITFPEGYTTEQMAARLSATFPHFDTAAFMTLTAGQQGYLFPDTYEFSPTPQPQEVVAALESNYEQQIAPLRPSIAASGHSEADIIIMASILEKEAKGPVDSPIIAGILWKRIADGIALQVDADPSTYAIKGLPQVPIDNPGLVAIQAAIAPTASPYLYYLHDANGNVHYASTFQQHEQNIRKYLE